MKNMLIKEIAGPLLRRGGTLIAALLVAKGFPSEVVEQAVLAATALFAVSIDLVLSSWSRR